MIALALLACSPEESLPLGDDSPSGPAPAALVEPSAGACPDFGDEVVSFVANGQDREARVYLPDGEAPEGGWPAVFAWHPLGATASQIVSWMDLADFADEMGVVVVVPEALDSNMFEWGFMSDGADDLAVYDDLRTCLVREAGVDPYRISSTGMSAGGLWTTFLAIRRGDTLSTVLVMSGGTEPVQEYMTPFGPKFPALLMWGGDRDTWGSSGFTIDFQATTLAFADELEADGHFVARCNHGRGHTIPTDGMDVTTDWLLSHRFGEESPWATGERGVDELADYCE